MPLRLFRSACLEEAHGNIAQPPVPALTDLLGGQIDFLFDPGIALQHVKTGKRRMLAVPSRTGRRRFPKFPP
jgi:hypothetical protein